jgi:hypothetical protein
MTEKSALRGYEAAKDEALNVLDTWLQPGHLLLHAGEMKAQELRTVLAVLRAVRGCIRDL